MSPSLAAVSTVRERRAFTSSIAVYSSCLTFISFIAVYSSCLTFTSYIAVYSSCLTFTSSIAVYSSCLKQMLLQLLKRISVRVLSSPGTGTSTRLLQVPRVSSMSLCVYFTVIWSQLSAAVHCCLQHTQRDKWHC